jgi:hypothetical protein
MQSLTFWYMVTSVPLFLKHSHSNCSINLRQTNGVSDKDDEEKSRDDNYDHDCRKFITTAPERRYKW